MYEPDRNRIRCRQPNPFGANADKQQPYLCGIHPKPVYTGSGRSHLQLDGAQRFYLGGAKPVNIQRSCRRFRYLYSYRNRWRMYQRTGNSSCGNKPGACYTHADKQQPTLRRFHIKPYNNSRTWGNL